MNAIRNGNFTSSEIYNLTKTDRSGKGFGVPAITYIEECNMERRLGRSLSDESNARPLSWGKCLEPIAFNKLGFDYELKSSETIIHPDIPYWVGSPDGVKNPSTVFDIKCPITLKSFCQLVGPVAKNDPEINGIDHIRNDHKDGEKYYWQLVSNAILTGSDYAELIVYVPYQTDLDEIRLIALDEDRYRWIANAEDTDIPYLVPGGFYKDINIIGFIVPESDKQLLTDCVIRAGKMLI